MLLVDPPPPGAPIRVWSAFLAEMEQARESTADIETANYWIKEAKRRLNDIEHARQRAKDYNPYHEPAGSPEGGRFASGPGGGGGEPETYERGGGGGPSKVAEVERKARESVAAGAKKSREMQMPLEGSKSIHPATIATRHLTSVGADRTRYVQPSLKAMQEDHGKFELAMERLRDPNGYPNLTREEMDRPAPERARALIDNAKANLRFIYDHAPPRVVREARFWYDSARLFIDKSAKDYKLDDASVAGVYAALSPQKLWDMNVYMAHAVIDIHRTKQDYTWDDKMSAVAERMWMPKNPDDPTRNDMNRQALAGLVADKKLSELTSPEERAVWIRTYAEAHVDKRYRVVKLDGTLGDYFQTKPDKHGVTRDALVQWQSTTAISSAVRALESGGDREIISDAMGDEHKVRSFYNNMLDPHSDNLDVTIDTHAVGAALLRPLSGANTAVMHALGTAPQSAAVRPDGWAGVPKSAVTGVRGLYGLYAQAYRELADDLHIQPRQLQSITWEAKRLLFTRSIKDSEKDAIEATWDAYHNGAISLSDAQQAVLDVMGGSINDNPSNAGGDEDDG